MEGMIKDLRQGFRMLVRTPLLSVVAILTIGLGVGATSFAFSVVYGTMLRGLPVRDADRLMAVLQARPAENVDQMWMPIHDYHELRDRQTAFEHLAAGYSGTVNLAGDEGPPERFQGGWVTARMLSMLGVPPLHGRTFAEGDDLPGAPALLLLGYDTWRNRFGGSPDVIGRTARVNGETATIIGVMPEGFQFPFNEDLWLPLRVDPDATARRGGQYMLVAGYLREGVPLQAAQEELAAIARGIEEEFPEHNAGITVDARPYTDAFVPEQISSMMFLMMAMVTGVLLVACANVANVLLARAAVREKEVAVRSALGAHRWRVVRQLLAEAVALGIAGGVVGLAVAYVSLGFFRRTLVDIDKPYWIEFNLDGPAILFTTLVTVTAAVVAGIVPAIRASGAGLDTVLRDESRGSSSLRLGRLSTGLVIAELAVSCGLMIGAGLLVRTLVDLNRLDLGFEPDQVLTARMGLFDTDYPDADARNRFYHQLLERLESETGIVAATIASGLPGTGSGTLPVQVEGEVYVADADVPRAASANVSPGFFETFGVALVDGRDFRLAESERGGDPVAIVNRSFVERRLSGGNAVGRRVRAGGLESDAPWLQIVGVVPDLHEGVGGFGGGGQVREAVYQPLSQADLRFASVAMRTPGAPGEAAGPLRRVLAELDPNLPLYWLVPMREALDETTFLHRIFGTLFAIFGGAALFLAAVGLYGVIDFSVSSRLREMGLRMAMGAEGRDVLTLVFRRVLVQLAVGIAVGLGIGAALGKPLSATLFGVRTFDPLVYVTIVGTLVLTGVIAALVPALRAVRVDPVVALRA